MLAAELDDNDGRWRSPEERQGAADYCVGLLRGFGWRGKEFAYPAGEVGLLLRYAAALTGCDSLVTARLWRSRTGSLPGDVAVATTGESDTSDALRHSGWVLSIENG